MNKMGLIEVPTCVSKVSGGRSNELVIRAKGNVLSQISVFDFLGRQVAFHDVASSKGEIARIPAHWTPGVYFIKVTTDTGTETRKIIKK